MGRALFTEKYTRVVVHEANPEPEPEKWSRWNNYFDPDSEEFFQNAEQEMFTDTTEYMEEYRRELVAAEGHIPVSSDVVVGPDSSVSSESSDSSEPSEQGSPLVVATDPNQQLTTITESGFPFGPQDLDQHRVMAEGWIRQRIQQPLHERDFEPIEFTTTLTYVFGDPPADGLGPLEYTRSRPVTVIRPRSLSLSSGNARASPLRNSAIPSAGFIPSRPLYATMPPPPAISAEPVTPRPATPESRENRTIIGSVSPYPPRHLLSPSPPPSVSPHLFTWNRRAFGAVPPSPLTGQGAMGMHNADARVSRVNVLPSLVHVQNAAI